MKDKYRCGDYYIPEWLQPRLMIYKRLDGNLGFEFYMNHDRVFALVEGDEIIKDGARMTVKRKDAER